MTLNVFSPGRAGSELAVRESLINIMEAKEKILVTSFASNVARMEAILLCQKN